MTPKDVIGSVYGRLTITGEAPRTTHNRKVTVMCECGVCKDVALCDLRTGRTTSCGCLRIERTTTHGLSRKKGSLYRVWASMKSRCLNVGTPGYLKYGGRGITVCVEWADSFEAFNDWAQANGYAASLTLDREDNNKGYSSENCRWVDKTTQSRNRRSAQGSSSQFIGVYRCTTRQMWVAQITVDKKKKTLGLFQTELEAAQAREQFIKENSLTDFTLNNVL